MKPIEPEGGDTPAENGESEVEATFRRLAQAKHASEAFYTQVMARAAELPPPRPKGFLAMPWQGAYPCLPRAATLTLVSVLLLCMAGLGYLYLRVGQMQAVVEQEQVRQPKRAVDVARVPPEQGAKRTREGEYDLVALSQITLEFDPPDSKSDDSISADLVLLGPEETPVSGAKSMIDQWIDSLQTAFSGVWDKVKGEEPEPNPSR